MKILLINQYAGNKGDRAVLFATCLLLQKIDPLVQIVVSTSSPELWDGYHFYQERNITFVPYAWDYENIIRNKCYWNYVNKMKKYTFTIIRESFLRFHFFIFKFLINPSFYKKAQEVDLIISLGGHHFTTILSQDLISSNSFDSMVILSLKKKLICFSQSFGPFKFYNNRNKLATQKILSKSILYPREKGSKDELLKLNIPLFNIKETYETVLSLNLLFNEYIKPTERKKQIGIAIYSTAKRPPEVLSNYINSIVCFCNYAIKQNYSICFFPMELKGTEPDDRPLITEILNNIQEKNNCTFIDVDMETEEHLRAVAKCRLFIGHKTHSAIFALASGTPLIAIKYHPKTMEFMKQFQISKYVIDDKYLTSSMLIEKFNQIIPNLNLIGVKTFNQSRQISQIIQNDLTLIMRSL